MPELWLLKVTTLISKILMVRIPLISINISLTDMANGKQSESRSADIIKNRIRTRYTIEFLGTWEMIHNPNFKVVEFDQNMSCFETFQPKAVVLQYFFHIFAVRTARLLTQTCRAHTGTLGC